MNTLDPKEGTRLVLLAAGIITVDDFMRTGPSAFGVEIVEALSGRPASTPAAKCAETLDEWVRSLPKK